jgi:phenylalanine-4-hydroxylase
MVDTSQTPAADGTIAQRWESYTAAEHATWDRLMERQAQVLQGRAVDEFHRGVSMLGMDGGGIPHFGRLSERLMRATGWQVLAVPGLVDDALFFEHLANRRFVAGRFIRRPDQLDYLQEPDVFHDVFGHVPLLADPVFADYMQAYGEGGLRALNSGVLHKLARLYWYTVEFGLIRTADGLRIYGAGIVSSKSESIFALESPSPHRIGFDLKRLLSTRYRIDTFQQNYFVIDSFQQLLDATLHTDFAPIYAELRAAQDVPCGALLPGDRVLTSGTQDYPDWAD